MRRTKEDAEKTRCAILAAAEQLFLERGVAHTSLEQIARHAGVTRGAVYWHFQNKAHLFHEMLNQVRLPLEPLAQQLAAVDGLSSLQLLLGDILFERLLQKMSDADRDALARQSTAAGVRVADDDTWSDIFSRLLSEKVEPHLGHGRPTLLNRYPVVEAEDMPDIGAAATPVAFGAHTPKRIDRAWPASSTSSTPCSLSVTNVWAWGMRWRSCITA